ncbi:MAG TPA: DUF4252 domain-containing protein [Acidobacteriaceae bacterium]|jgi:hypothetical protein|nr:DUF4252 domain-containing protein [Acidobacteriaceae bacterium]
MTASRLRNFLRLAWAATVLAAAFSLPARAQSEPSPFPVTLEKQLATRAANYTEVTLDRKMLDFASHFMNDKDDAEGKRIVAKLNGVYVRTYEFDKPGQYTAEDLASIRSQFQTSEWSPMVKERSKDGSDDSDIYMKLVNGEVQGMFILNAEAKELNFVYIDGPIHPEDLADISGNFGIPAKTYKKVEKAEQKGKDRGAKASDGQGTSKAGSQ